MVGLCGLGAQAWGQSGPSAAQAPNPVVRALGALDGGGVGPNTPALTAQKLSATGASAWLLDEAARQASRAHPSVQAAQAESQALRAEVEAVQRQRWPSVSVGLEGTSSSQRGASTQSASARALVSSVEQTLWDGGRQQAVIDETQARQRAAEWRLADVRDQLALRAAEQWRQWAVSAEKERVSMLTLQVLDGYVGMMQRRVDAQVSSRIELDLVDARASQVRVDAVAYRSAANAARQRLAVLLGETPSGPQWSQAPALQSLGTDTPATSPQQRVPAPLPTDWLARLDDLPTVQQALLEAQAARFRLSQREREQYPSVFARLQDTRASGGTASGSSLSIGLRYSPGAGWSSLATARAAVARAEGAEAAVEAARREVQDLVRADDEEQRSAAERVSLLQAAVERSATVLESYQRQFTAGRKSWQEVLDATRELYQNRVAHADALAQAQVGAYRLRLRLRSHPWQTTGAP